MFKKTDIGHSEWTVIENKSKNHGHPGWDSVSTCEECRKDTIQAPFGRAFTVPKKIKSIYIIGSLRNPEIPKFANELQAQGFEAFADWYAPGPQADDYWRDYATARGLSYGQALKSPAATHVYEFDKSNLDRCDAAVMLMPAGKSAHLELGYTIGKGKPGYILFDQEPERYDVMVQFATGVFFSKEGLFYELKEVQNNGNS